MKTKVFNLIIVDESGSMYTIEREAFSGMNETLQTIKAVAQENQELEQRVTLITFDSHHTRFHYDNAEGNAVVPLKEGDYRPGGCTPLYDAIGMGISKVNALVGENDSVLVTIITDGYENSSHEYNLTMVKNLIEKLKKQRWTFTFIGTDDLDVEGMAQAMGIRHTLSFCRDSAQTSAMFAEEKASRMEFYNRRREEIMNRMSMSEPCPQIIEDEEFFDKKHV